MKKFFIKICKLFGFEIIDQNEFISPTLNKELNKDLSILNKKSIVLPLGEVKITRKVKSILIIIRVNTEIEVWDQNKRRLFEKPKIEYSIRSIKSLINSINYCQSKYLDLKIKTIILDDSSKIENLDKIKEIIKDVNGEIISLDTKKFEAKIKKQKTQQTFSNLASLYQCFEIGKEIGEDLIFFIEDDYLHFETMLEEMITTYERVSSQVGKDIFMCPADYPYLYNKLEDSKIILGNNCHWRSIEESLCTFLTSKKIINKHFKKFVSACEFEHYPFEKPFHDIYKKELCISPMPALAVHFTNINSIYGLSPLIDYEKLWKQNKI